MIGHSLKNIFESLGFTYDFAFCQNTWSLKNFQNVLWSMSFKNDKIYKSFWGVGGFPKQISKTIEIGGSKFDNFLKFQKVKIIFVRMSPYTF